MKIERAKGPDDPERCQNNTQQGPCVNKAVPGCKFCPIHGGGVELKYLKQKQLDNYRLTKYQSRASELSGNNKIASLHDEVALTRILIEELWNRCEDDVELLLRSGPLSDLLMKAQKLVSECQRLDEKTNNLWGREKVVQAAQIIVEIIGKHIEDSDLLEQIATEIIEALDTI